MSKIVVFLFVCSLVLNSACVFAMDLQQAKSSGLVGEQLNGYLGVVSGNDSADVHALIKDINAKRKAKYKAIATQNNTSLETVEILAGKKAIEKTENGHYIQTATGWVKK